MFVGWSSDSDNASSSGEEIRIGKRRRANRDRAWEGVFCDEEVERGNVHFCSASVQVQAEEDTVAGVIDLCAGSLSSSDEAVLPPPPPAPAEEARVSIQLPMERRKMAASYGKGLGLLEKMGYRGGGLGRLGEGRVAPVQVKMRAKQRGLHEGESRPAVVEEESIPTRPRLIPSRDVREQVWDSSSEEESFVPVEVVDMTGVAPRVISASAAVRGVVELRAEVMAREVAALLAEAVRAEKHAARVKQDLADSRTAAEEELRSLEEQVSSARALHADMVRLARRVTHFDLTNAADLYDEVKSLKEHSAWNVTDASQVATALLTFLVRKQAAAGTLIDEAEVTTKALSKWRDYICETEEEVFEFDELLRAEFVPAVVAFFKQWTPEQEAGLRLYRCLPLVLRDSDHVAFIRNREVLPRLKNHLKCLEVDPRDQRISPLLDVLAWVEVLPNSCIGSVLCDSLLPKWLSTLTSWVDLEGVRYTEVAKWYRGWRSLITTTLLENTDVRGFFMEGCRILLRSATRFGE